MPGMDLEGQAEFEAAIEDFAEDLTTDDPERVVGTNVEYAPHVEFGTAPHTITGDPLAFPDGTGGTAFATEVQHPGTDPQPHVRPGARATEGELARLAVQANSLEEFLDMAALHMEGEIKRRTPVESGNLRGSYRVF